MGGAELVRSQAYRYGRFAARVQFAPGDGVVSTFFLWKDGSERPEVFWNEIDIEKLGATCTGYSSNAIYGLPQSNHTLPIVSTDDLCTGYHTHAIEWTPDYLAWMLDGREVRRLAGADLLAFEQNALPGMQMRFNIWVGNADFGGVLSPQILPVFQYINWVSYSEYTPGTGDGGSDFTLAWRDDFDAPLDAGWFSGNWASPYNNSVHSPANVVVVDGKAVLALTSDDALGFTGVVPADPEDIAAPGSPEPDPTNGGVIAPLEPGAGEASGTPGTMNGGTVAMPGGGQGPTGAIDPAAVPAGGSSPSTVPTPRSDGSSGCSLPSSSPLSSGHFASSLQLVILASWLGLRRRREPDLRARAERGPKSLIAHVARLQRLPSSGARARPDMVMLICSAAASVLSRAASTRRYTSTGSPCSLQHCRALERTTPLPCDEQQR